MPAGSSARISSIEAVQGTMAENTCCSRMRRAISWVYCPPKSRTTIPWRALTMPPASPSPPDLAGTAPLLDLIYPSRSSQHDIHKLPRHDYYFHNFFVDDQNGNARILQRLGGRFVLAQSIIDEHLPTQTSVDLNDHLELLFVGQIFAVGRPFHA